MPVDPPSAPDIVVIDDQPASCDFLDDLLTSQGFLVRAFGDARAALKALRARPADVVVVDLRMPGMDGVEFARAFRAGPGGPTRLMAISGEVDADDAVRQHFDCFFAKPIDVVAVPAKLRALAETSRRLRDQLTPPRAPKASR